MPKTFNMTKASKLEIKNEDDDTAELDIFGDIVGSNNPNDPWSYSPDATSPGNISDFLKQLDGKKNVDIHINSGGGDAFAGIAIYNLLKVNQAQKTVHIDGIAASAASVIAMVGDKIIMPTGSMLMIHNAWTIALGNADDFRKQADDLDRLDESILDIYTENLKDKRNKPTIKSMMDKETWLKSDEAAQYFNIDIDEQQAAASIDSKFYKDYKHLPSKYKESEAQKRLDSIEDNQKIILSLLQKSNNKAQKSPSNNDGDFFYA